VREGALKGSEGSALCPPVTDIQVGKAEMLMLEQVVESVDGENVVLLRPRAPRTRAHVWSAIYAINLPSYAIRPDSAIHDALTISKPALLWLQVGKERRVIFAHVLDIVQHWLYRMHCP